MQEKRLIHLSNKIRLNLLLELQHMGYGHYGGSLSIIEALAVIYGNYMEASPENRNTDDRNYFVLSKGHAGPALYATLKEFGFIDDKLLFELNEGGKNLPSHPNRILTPGVDMSTGSLGQGISCATGLAYGLKLKKYDKHVYSIVGDGEMNEGQCWESLQFIKAKNLNNLVTFIDNNGKQLDGYTKDINDQLSYSKKLESFGFNTIEVDGKNVVEIKAAIETAHSNKEQPTVIILNTVKGQGVPYIEKLVANHHLRPTSEDNNAIEEAICKLREEMKQDA